MDVLWFPVALTRVFLNMKTALGKLRAASYFISAFVTTCTTAVPVFSMWGVMQGMLMLTMMVMRMWLVVMLLMLMMMMIDVLSKFFWPHKTC